mmetsp:Transcript_68936/g.121872  ORF Transcript_68936/g.121872 Transcript_68936/m.121872 type:complete len:181 (-) Transcript_68936:94-636(-)|eukprot:CAMPEP_0197630646 /NCGR_PEP_ID=MMETSP1338-20131121/8057_1 /TAXON_ID=43686 ORGANISM="Pelagodinium beii, Strain RCC1491" /NCGR_SAMPLE_ID=MMETSP1338 /ASSEMBLY_ACC=CAM_ASM_000754 /LENGTH=180 /DNA_ID=CAMNT_0043201903 /DNA_START=44 /DNA_END=586 /DNA_ORIENTATION=+
MGSGASNSSSASKVIEDSPVPTAECADESASSSSPAEYLSITSRASRNAEAQDLQQAVQEALAIVSSMRAAIPKKEKSRSRIKMFVPRDLPQNNESDEAPQGDESLIPQSFGSFSGSSVCSDESMRSWDSQREGQQSTTRNHVEGAKMRFFLGQIQSSGWYDLKEDVRDKLDNSPFQVDA